MKIGVVLFVTDVALSPAALARKCESLGFESIFMPEHTVIPVDRKTPYVWGTGGEHGEDEMPDYYWHLPDPFIALALAASVTTRIKLGTGICLVPEHEPIALAKEIATLDRYSDGRFLFGIGAGWLVEESEVMGVEFRRRWPMTREYIRAMKELWTKPEATFEGRFVRFPAVRCYPKPAQRPHPPVLIGAGGMGPSCERALKDTVAIGDGWAPSWIGPNRLARETARLKGLCAEAGRDLDQIEISVFLRPQPGADPRRTIERYREAGAHRLVFNLPPLDSSRADSVLEDLARQYLP